MSLYTTVVQFKQQELVICIQWNAFTKSQNIPETCIFLFHALKIEFVRLYEALSAVDKPFQNQYCWGTNMW